MFEATFLKNPVDSCRKQESLGTVWKLQEIIKSEMTFKMNQIKYAVWLQPLIIYISDYIFTMN